MPGSGSGLKGSYGDVEREALHGMQVRSPPLAVRHHTASARRLNHTPIRTLAPTLALIMCHHASIP